MGIGYREIGGEPFGLVGDSIGDFTGMASLPSRIFKSRRKKHSKRSKNTNRRHGRASKKRRSKAQRSRGGIKYTKNGQPYKILANGRARFLKK